MLVSLVLGTLSLTSLALMLWQWLEGRLFPVHARRPIPSVAPPITVLKPLRGADAQTEACVESWFKQEYPGPVQLLFGVHDDDDPACGIVRRLIARFPNADARLIICRDRLGTNAKVSQLIQLEPHSNHDLLVISDADVRAPCDLLGQIALPFANPRVGLVNPLYRVSAPATTVTRWESVAVNADFWTGVLQSKRIEPMRFALGAVMAVRRRLVHQMGGFSSIANHLADDFELGRRVADENRLVQLCPVVVDCCHSRETWGAVWRRQLRWARTIRACRPLSYGLSIVANATLWPMLWLALTPGRSAAGVAALCLAIRVLTAFDNEKRLAQSVAHLPRFWMPLLKDALAAVLWGLAFTGNTVEWRGERYRIVSAGRIELIHPKFARSSLRPHISKRSKTNQDRQSGGLSDSLT